MGVQPGEFDFLVLTATAPLDANLAIAGSRAGALGVLNLEFARERDAAFSALARLLRYGSGRLGVLLDARAEELLADILSLPAAGVDDIILTASAPGRLPALVRLIQKHGRRAWLVASSLSEARSGLDAGVDALIAKGHEAGGWVGEETSFILLQQLAGRCDVPVYIHGGVGLHTAAACVVGGAAGAVLDSQLLLAKESPATEAVKARLRTLDGSETACLGTGFDARLRVYARPGMPAVEELRRFEAALLADDHAPDVRRAAWRAGVDERLRQGADDALLPLGQDAAFAADLARRFVTVGGILAGLRAAIAEQWRDAAELRSLAPESPLAQFHGTRYPIVQGPMTRVSDTAAFATAVAEGGALPFLALALLRGPEVESLLEETRRRIGERSWGVGILGFVPPELRAEQLKVVQAYRPPFALIAGGRPDQARVLEAEGIHTYLHVPSPGLLQLYLREGARRFVFEGRECGGHVGPRTSFVLWDTMVRVLLEELPSTADGADYCVLFAGGIHDGLSAAMVSAIAAPLAKRGVRLGVLVGTAYLFTEEAVRGGAITDAFQQAALACEQTVLLESGPGHATRCLPSPFAGDFAEEKRRLIQRGLPSEEIRGELEVLNIGRLRIASKGVDRHPRYGEDPSVPKLVELGGQEQWARGMYMIGQVASLQSQVRTIAALHADVSLNGTAALEDLAPERDEEPAPLPPADIAVVGIGTIMPGASDLQTFWDNIVNKVDAVREVPRERWDWHHYFDPDRNARDKSYSRWGGFIDPVPFDPVSFGMPPNSLKSIEPFQLLGLLVTQAALRDAGMLDRPFDRERTSVILGAGGGGADLSSNYVVRSSLPGLFGERAPELADGLSAALPEWTEDSFPGILMNVAAGRIANRFNFGGVNYTIDAACASSLAAVYQGVRELQAGTSEVAIVGGVDAIQNPFSYMCFSKTQALSPTGRCRPFDAAADGIAISEGFAALVLKRLADAERDGDRIYAVIRGAGGSSDGRDRSLTAPRPEGQIRALRRAYRQAGFSPATVELVEAHGTGTVAGDRAEVSSLSTFLGTAGAAAQNCAIGSVKSMIGHTKAAAGVAGLAKVALALHHRVLPATLGVSQPNASVNFPNGPIYVNTESRPWVHGAPDYPRRAGVSAFGFGGTNFHLVLEEYTGNFLPDQSLGLSDWPAELFVWRAHSRDEILAGVTRLATALERGARPPLADLAYTLARQAGTVEASAATLALVAGSWDELAEKLGGARDFLATGAGRQHLPTGVHFSAVPLAAEWQIAFLFPGQGSQYVNMARELAVVFPEVRAVFDAADQALDGRFEQPLSRLIFPPPVFAESDAKRQQAELTETNVAQPALGATGLAYLHLLRGLGVTPQMTAGHSYGEFVALHAAGCFDAATLLALSEARGRFMREGASEESGTMAAVSAAPEALQPLLADPELTLANLNHPTQTVVSGTHAAVERALAWCQEQGLRAQLLPVACAFHSPLVAPAQQRLAELLGNVAIAPPQMPVYSNTIAAPYPDDGEQMVALLAEHLVRPVEFVRQVRAMYAAGARVFVEVGPKSVLSGLVGRILGDEPHLCVPLDQAGRPSLVTLLYGLAALISEGTPVRLAELYARRGAQQLDLAALEQHTGEPRYSATTWLINGGRAWPASAPAPGILEPLKVAVVAEEEHAHVAPMAGRATTGNGAERGPAETPAPPAANGQQPPAAAAGSVPADQVDTARRRSESQDGLGMMDEDRQTALNEGVTVAKPAASPTPAYVSHPQVDDVMARFQYVMQHFLETQRSVMLAYLGSPSAAVAPTPGRPVRALAPAIEAPAVSQPRAAAPVDRVEDAVPFTPPAAATNGNGKHHAPAAASAEYMNGATEHAAPAAVPAAAPAPTPAPAVAPATAPAPAAPPAGLTRAQLTDAVLRIVSERTGYPPDMLALDADLEADLGIDSIKRVEIAGTALQTLPIPEGVTADVETLTGSRTLTQVIDALEALLGPATVAAGTAKEGGNRPFDPEPADDGVIGRFLLHTVASPAPPADRAAGLASEGAVLIVDDAGGVGVSLAERLARTGRTVIRVGRASESDPPQIVAEHLATPEAVAALVEELHRRAPFVSALVHLPALRAGEPANVLEIEAARSRLDGDLIALFLLAQALRPDLERAATAGGAALLAASAMSGAFASDGAAAFDPIQGALTGFVKTLAQEWPGVRAKAVDLDELTDPGLAAERLAAELLAADDVVEVGYRGGERVRVLPYAAPAGEPGLPPLARDAVVLITGGARGITAAVAQALAERYQPLLILVGRTAPPPEVEPDYLAGLHEPAEIKRALIAAERQAGRAVTPAAVERAYRRLLAEREVRDNLARLRVAGARVEYHACDVRDSAAFSALIEQLYARHGRIDGVIHGAGIIEDKLIRDKQLDSFERVISTKIDSALVLAKTLKPDSLRFLVFFSSVSGRFGNRGQGDYAAASEVLNKLACYLDRRWPAHVVSMIWGPWLTTGMVSPEVQRQFAERGVALIPLPVGCRRLVDELTRGNKGEVEVVIGGWTNSDERERQTLVASAPAPAPAPAPAASPRALPLLTLNGHAGTRGDGGMEFTRTLRLEDDRYLGDHRLDGRPVLPFTFALELMAEAAAAAHPELEVLAVRQQRFDRGVILDGPEQPLRLRVEAPGRVQAAHGSLAVAVAITGGPDFAQTHYRAIVELGQRLPAPPLDAPALLQGAGPLPMSIPEMYHAWLFHGPLFQHIETIEAIGPGGVSALLRPSSPAECLRDASGDWLFDPILADSALQVQVAWARMHWDMTLLPSALGAFVRFAVPRPASDTGLIRYEYRIRPETRAPLSHADHYFFSADGRLLGLISDMVGAGSKALNRLAQREQGTTRPGARATER